jgi:rhamnogalacturonan endolyase
MTCKILFLTLVLFVGTAFYPAAAGAVTVSEDDQTFTLANGVVTAMVAKSSGDLVSLQYKGREMFATFLKPDGQPDLQRDPPGENLNGLNRGMTDHQYGFWSHDAMGQTNSEPKAAARITIDPKANGGERGEVSVKGVSNGRRMGTGPGANGANFISDIEIRYAMGRGDSGVYTYCVFEHKPEYAASTITEARFCMKLNDFFDWMLVDELAHHNKLYPKTERENKYDYTSDQFEHRAYGWASTSEHIGCFLINPSVEYLSGGPTKIEFLCHRDTNPTAAPCVLNYWRSSHYGGAGVSVSQGEPWTKVVGPFLIYCNAGGDPQELWKDAIAQASREDGKWPYDWVAGVDYPHRDQRATVSGQLLLEDPLRLSAKMSRLLVGLTHPAYPAAGGGPAGARPVDWQTDAKYYEFWVHGADSGQFSIPDVRPGAYTLHAIADGVLGEFVKTDITVAAGKALDLGKLQWTPVRRGRQLWEIGIPNRTATEFFKGDDYFHDGMPVLYAQLFPNDINYVIGQSDFRKDWYYQQVPHADAASVAAADTRAGGAAALPGEAAPPARGPAATAPGRGVNGAPAGARGGRGGLFGPAASGTATPRSITFAMAAAPKGGKATLRLAICGTAARFIDVTVNDQPAGRVEQMIPDSTFGMGNGIQGIWYEREVAFDATLLKAGANVLKLTVPAGPVTAGVIYDYLRLELDESAPLPLKGP